MIPEPMEFLGRARLQILLEAADYHRLLKSVAAQQANGSRIQEPATTIGQIRCWLGTQLVKWGFSCKVTARRRCPNYPKVSRATANDRKAKP
jgi:hypothetical protein